ncbi:MAG: SOS response-associated peptidase [Solirubrobacteraceae bacterium]
MCGRYTNGTVGRGELDSRFGVTGDDDVLGALGRYNVAPSEALALVTVERDPADPARRGRRAATARWGLLPPWARSLRERVRPINARAETLTSSRLFAPLVTEAEHRVLVVADGWYEWLRREEPADVPAGGRAGRRPDVTKVPFHHRVDDGAPFAMAGVLRTVWLDRDALPEDVVPSVGGTRAARGADTAGTTARDGDGGGHTRCVADRPGRVAVPTVAIITCAANAVASRLHDRMPAILAGPDEEEAWLSSATGPADVAALLAPLADGRVSVAAASPLVNDARAGRDGPELLDPRATTAAPAPARRVPPAQLSLLPADRPPR